MQYQTMKRLKEQDQTIATLRAALEGLVGASAREDLLGIRELFLPGSLIDRLGRGEHNAASLAAIDALLALIPPAPEQEEPPYQEEQ